MTPEAVAESIYRALQKVGQQIILERNLVAPGNTTLPNKLEGVWAQVRGFQPHELTDMVIFGDREVTISNREIKRRSWPGPPRKNDTVLFPDGTQARVMGVASINVGTIAVKHTLHVRGT